MVPLGSVVDEMAFEQLFEVAVGARNLRLDRSERPLECKRREWIAPVQPGSQRPKHERDTARKRAGIVLAQPELNRVESGIDGRRIDAMFG